jgi:hypothetical protein
LDFGYHLSRLYFTPLFRRIGQMRKLRCCQAPGLSVQELLDEFNERADEFGIVREADIVSVCAMPPLQPAIEMSAGGKPAVEVVIFYWSDR